MQCYELNLYYTKEKKVKIIDNRNIILLNIEIDMI